MGMIMINEVEHKLNAELMDRIRRIKHIALDMDGTIYNGNTLFPFTIAFLDKMKELGIGYSFLTNNPSKSTNDYLRHLSGMGIKAVKDEFYTSAQATIDYIRVHHPECKRLFLLGTPSMIKEFEEAGFRENYGPGRVVASEWTSKAEPFVPQPDLTITLKNEGEGRVCDISANSALGNQVLEVLKK